MSQPSDPCLGCKALWISFFLCEELTNTEDSACARVDDYWQGEVPTPNAADQACNSTCTGIGQAGLPAVKVFNLKKPDNSYVFSGPAGSAGLACYDDIEDKYRIVYLDSPCCLDINFIVESVNSDGSAVVTIIARPCGCQKVPEEYGGRVTVRPMSCTTFQPGMEGWAKYVQEPAGICYWKVYSLCC
jgi:hypothetical protein